MSNLEVEKGKPTIVLGHHDIDSIYASQQERMIRIFESLGVRAYICGDTHKKGIKMLNKYDVPGENIPCIICGKSAVQTGDTYSDVGIIEYIWKYDGYVYVVPCKWGEKYSFKKADDFLYDIYKDYRFLMISTMSKFTETRSLRILKQHKISTVLASKKYTNITEAHPDIALDIKDGGCFWFYGQRGATFIGNPETNSIIRELKSQDNMPIKFLISYPFSENIRYRLQNIPKYFNENKCGEKWGDTYNKVAELMESYKDFNDVKIRFHDTSLIFRLLFTKKHLYLGYYEPGKHSKDTAIYQFDSDTPTYQTYNSFFNHLWMQAYHSIPKKIPPKYSFLNEKRNFFCQSIIGY